MHGIRSTPSAILGILRVGLGGLDLSLAAGLVLEVPVVLLTAFEVAIHSDLLMISYTMDWA